MVGKIILTDGLGYILSNLSLESIVGISHFIKVCKLNNTRMYECVF